MAADPSTDDFAAGNVDRFRLESFNFIYTSLLGTLERLMNGHHDQSTFSRAIELMKSLEDHAHAMMGADAGQSPLGPTFEYQPQEPRLDSVQRQRLDQGA